MQLKQLTSDLWAVVGVPQTIGYMSIDNDDNNWLKIDGEKFHLPFKINSLPIRVSDISEEQAGKLVEKKNSKSKIAEEITVYPDYISEVQHLFPSIALNSLCTLHGVKDTDILMIKK